VRWQSSDINNFTIWGMVLKRMKFGY
jgi:hypothetical protein